MILAMFASCCLAAAALQDLGQVHPSGQLFVLNNPTLASAGDDFITVITPDGGARVFAGPNPAFNGMTKIEFDQDGDRLYALQSNSAVFRIDPSTHALTLLVGAESGLENPSGIYFDAELERLWVAANPPYDTTRVFQYDLKGVGGLYAEVTTATTAHARGIIRVPGSPVPYVPLGQLDLIIGLSPNGQARRVVSSGLHWPVDLDFRYGVGN
jgi:hypothetical protein